MSTFEDYNTTSNNYDNQRKPIGADVVAAMVQMYCNKQLKAIHLLDAGCGTGNYYSKALIDHGTGKLTLLDASAGMLRQARTKLADAVSKQTIVEIIEHKLPELPFKDKSFDAVLFSLVLHHLNPGHDEDEANRFQELERTMVEARRVLRPDGTLIVITSSLNDIYNIWYYNINKAITEKYVKRFATVLKYLEIFERSGFECVQNMRLLGPLMTSHLNPEGPFDKAWRDCDSYWATFNGDELNDVKARLLKLKENGKLEDWVRSNDHVLTNGIVTMFVCKKSELGLKNNL